MEREILNTFGKVQKFVLRERWDAATYADVFDAAEADKRAPRAE